MQNKKLRKILASYDEINVNDILKNKKIYIYVIGQIYSQRHSNVCSCSTFSLLTKW